MAETSEERTHKATDKRMREVRREGKLERSQDLSAWFGLGATALALGGVVTAGGAAATTSLQSGLRLISKPTGAGAEEVLGASLGSILPTVGVLFAIAAVAAVAASLVPNGVSIKQFKAHTDQFNLASGLGRLFGGRAWWKGAQTLLKTVVVAVALGVVASLVVPQLLGSGIRDVPTLLATASQAVTWLLAVAIAAGIVLAVADLGMVARRNRKHTMMTTKELKDESKSAEGDPLVKQQRRSRAMAIGRTRMITAVDEADVVLVNPTEYAVALRYVPGRSAPRVVAKGRGVVAARIRERAAAHDVPMIKDIPLTRTLHAVCDLNQEIPVELYTAVALVLTFVAALQRRGPISSAVHSLPAPAPVPDAASLPRRRRRIRR